MTFDIEQQRQRIAFLRPTDLTEELTGGFGSLNYLIVRGQEKFHLKINPGSQTADDFAKLAKKLKLYEVFQVPASRLIDCGNFDQADFYYYVFEYVAGQDLQKAALEQNLSEQNLYELGFQVGSDLKKLKSYQNTDLFESFELEKEALTLHNKFETQLKENADAAQFIHRYFSDSELEKIKNLFFAHLKYFDNDSQNIIHGDMKMPNLIFTPNQQLFLIDCEVITFNYDVFNFRYQYLWTLPENKLSRVFMTGFFVALYDSISPTLNRQLALVLMFNFFESVLRKITANNYTSLAKFLSRYQIIFQQIENNVAFLN